jgi:hypothetical protein
LQRLEQFLVYADDSKRELATVNLLVQRNIPVTFGRNAVDIINDTLDPDAEPRIMKAIPVHPLAKNEPAASATTKARPSATPKVRKAIPLQKFRKD